MVPRSCMEFAEWFWYVEKAIAKAVSECSPRAWNEDHITYSWIEAIRNTGRNIVVTGWPRPFHIAWDAYKAVGTLEESNGDVAVLVKQTFPNHNELVGTAFLEAKRIYKSDKFDKLDWRQIYRQSKHSASHRLLLYDNRDVSLDWVWQCPAIYPPPHMHPLSDEWYNCAEYSIAHFTTRATVCLPQHAIAYRTKTRDLHEISAPLSHQLCLRYFLGQDLDYDPTLAKAVSDGFASGVDYLIVAHVRFGEQGETTIASVNFSRDAYCELADGEHPAG